MEIIHGFEYVCAYCNKKVKGKSSLAYKEGESFQCHECNKRLKVTDILTKVYVGVVDEGH